ncbi:MAG: PAS domain S-box protein, partial [Methanosarcinaceae archaeon]|nr:PAS domain S-box protein [Methanosarcinaceae archaeon]
EGKYFSGNTAAHEIFGFKNEDEFVSQAPSDLSPQYQPDGSLSSEKAQMMIEEVIKKGSRFFEWTYKRTNGEEFFASVLLTRMELEGKVVLQATVRDITERKQAEETLRIERDNLENIFEAIEDGIYIVNQHYDIQYVNPVLTKEFGAYEGIKCYEYFHDLTEACPWCKNPDVLAGKTVHWEWTSLRNQKTYDLIDTPLKNPDGSISKLEIFRDITERKQAEEELKVHRDHLEEIVKERIAESEDSRQALISLVEDLATMTDDLKNANESLQELDLMKSMFIASTSHELRTPLNSIIGFTSVLLEGWSGNLNPEQKEQLGIVLTSGKHLLSLINDVIDISKIEAGKLEICTEHFNLGDVVNEAASFIKTDVEEKGLTLTTDVPDIIIGADRRRLLQCIINLLSNAVKFSEKGSIAINAKTINNVVDISISDTGIGIKEEDIPKLFNAFVRLESHLTDITSGTGLGLYLTNKLAHEVLGGTIDVTSKYGEGSTFILHIPMTQGVET